MGGTGSGMAYDEDDLRRIGGAGLAASPTTEVLLEESILGWKEYELEVMRDTADNVVIVCSIENLDPMGVHTGDSITVAPAMTLTDREYQSMRDLAIGIIRAVGVDTGGCNIQYAVNPADGRADRHRDEPAGLAVQRAGLEGHRLPDRQDRRQGRDRLHPRRDPQRHHRAGRQSTPASFEPTLDYVVVKVPRFAFEKFPGADPTLTTHMKSVGEAMAIGRNFTEALQKALRSLESKDGAFDFAPAESGRRSTRPRSSRRSAAPHDGRLQQVMDAIRAGATPEQVFEATEIDPWFVDQLFADQRGRRRGRRRRRARRRRRCAWPSGTASPTPRSPRSAGMSDDVVRGVRHGARHPPGLQDRRHLRRRVRRARRRTTTRPTTRRPRSRRASGRR